PQADAGAEAGDREAPHGAAARADVEADRRGVAGRVVEADQRTPREARLALTGDRERLRDRGQLARQRDRVHARTGDRELDRVRTGSGVRRVDGGAQRSGAGVARVRDHEGCGACRPRHRETGCRRQSGGEAGQRDARCHSGALPQSIGLTLTSWTPRSRSRSSRPCNPAWSRAPVSTLSPAPGSHSTPSKAAATCSLSRPFTTTRYETAALSPSVTLMSILLGRCAEARARLGEPASPSLQVHPG